MKETKGYGWDTPPENVIESYVKKCEIFSKDDESFKKFRQDSDYKLILEGWNEGGQVWLDEIVSKFGTEILLKYLPLFKRNDLYGSPTIYNYPIVGDMCPFTLKYVLDALRLIDKLGNREYKNIVEVGAGFGSMCIVMHSLFDFDKYTIVDLPSVIGLTRKYLSHFPDVYSKVEFISCDELDCCQYQQFDLFISDAALSECNLQTQLLYFEKFVKKSKFGYINYNTLGVSDYASNYIKFISEINNHFDLEVFHQVCNYLYFKRKEK